MNDNELGAVSDAVVAAIGNHPLFDVDTKFGLWMTKLFVHEVAARPTANLRRLKADIVGAYEERVDQIIRKTTKITALAPEPIPTARVVKAEEIESSPGVKFGSSPAPKTTSRGRR